MFALGIKYLNGFVAAAEHDARDLPEWPPHPARVFMALAAAYFETRGQDEDERGALEWLESLPPPQLKTPEAVSRAVVTQYVPVNDKAGEKQKPPTAIIQSLPQLTRDRQPRTFARLWVADERAYLVWPSADPQDRLAALQSLCAKVTRIGHSSSLVQMWVAKPEEVSEVNWIPSDEGGERYLRVTSPGTLDELEFCYRYDAVERYGSLVVTAETDTGRDAKEARKLIKREFGNRPPQRLRPRISSYQGYVRVTPQVEPSGAAVGVFSPNLVIFGLERRSGPFFALGLESTLAVIQRWREAILSYSNGLPERIRGIISGHDPDGEKLQEPHLALFPLSFVGHPHADGHLVGLAAAMPAALSNEARAMVLRTIGRVRELKLGRLGVWGLVRDVGDRPAWNLRAQAWVGGSEGATKWATVTPVVFDRHPKDKDAAAYQAELAEMIATACTAVGLPKPSNVVVSKVSRHLGCPPSYAFSRMRRKDGSERRHMHAILSFDEPVRGPVLIGAGRYRGYGVCRPVLSGAGE